MRSYESYGNREWPRMQIGSNLMEMLWNPTPCGLLCKSYGILLQIHWNQTASIWNLMDVLWTPVQILWNRMETWKSYAIVLKSYGKSRLPYWNPMEIVWMSYWSLVEIIWDLKEIPWNSEEFPCKPYTIFWNRFKILSHLLGTLWKSYRSNGILHKSTPFPAHRMEAHGLPWKSYAILEKSYTVIIRTPLWTLMETYGLLWKSCGRLTEILKISYRNLMDSYRNALRIYELCGNPVLSFEKPIKLLQNSFQNSIQSLRSPMQSHKNIMQSGIL